VDSSDNAADNELRPQIDHSMINLDKLFHDPWELEAGLSSPPAAVTSATWADDDDDNDDADDCVSRTLSQTLLVLHSWPRLLSTLISLLQRRLQ